MIILNLLLFSPRHPEPLAAWQSISFFLDCFGLCPPGDDCGFASPLRHCELRSSEAIQKKLLLHHYNSWIASLRSQ
ncbi:MAG: hypothetical protein LBE71_05865 [Dysgonamonadaceae bacterium]|nr:hypothetical protein [Dysgonamonadaceae bacterium]